MYICLFCLNYNFEHIKLIKIRKKPEMLKLALILKLSLLLIQINLL